MLTTGSATSPWLGPRLPATGNRIGGGGAGEEMGNNRAPSRHFPKIVSCLSSSFVVQCGLPFCVTSTSAPMRYARPATPLTSPCSSLPPDECVWYSQIVATAVISVVVIIFTVSFFRPFDGSRCTSKTLGLAGGLIMAVYAALQGTACSCGIFFMEESEFFHVYTVVPLSDRETGGI